MDGELFTCFCYYCGGTLAFSAEENGSEMRCPHCGKQTRLHRLWPFPRPSAALAAQPVDESESAKINSGEQSLLQEQGGSRCFVITLSPGNVRYIYPAVEFWRADVDSVIAHIKQLSPCPTLQTPDHYYCHNEYGGYGIQVPGLRVFNRLVQGESWDARLRLHHAVGRMLKMEGMPITVYCLFHSHLHLAKQFALAECLEAWIKGTEKDRNLMESYRTSSEHIVVTVPPGDSQYDKECSGCVFRKTDFVKEWLARGDEQKAKEDLESLNKTRFDSFVYIMEDPRNKTFKIGRSKTPNKRERTLQSEVPEIMLRFAIPADEEDERRLHGRFDPQRQRGEWFSLTPDELLWVVSFLKKRGDVSRVTADYEWLGRIILQASGKSDGE